MAQAASLDAPTAALVRFAAAIAAGHDARLAAALESCRVAETPAVWIEELLLQSLLMVGYPRTLVAAGAWRATGAPAPAADPDAVYANAAAWAARGEAACRTVYGANYDRLRENVQRLHPALDAWMVTEGYGRTLSRPGLDLVRRELCTVAQTAVLETPHQLHSHLRGALNAGATADQVAAALALGSEALSAAQRERAATLWWKVQDGRSAPPGDTDNRGH